MPPRDRGRRGGRGGRRVLPLDEIGQPRRDISDEPRREGSSQAEADVDSAADASRTPISGHHSHSSGQRAPVPDAYLVEAIRAAVAATRDDAAQVSSVEKILKRAKELGAREFVGTTDPEEANNWLERVEKAFKTMRITDDQKAQNVVSLLAEDAYRWWKIVERRYSEPTWQEFLEEFRAKYLRTEFISKKRREYYSLKQENLSVAEYEARYTKLYEFVVDQVPDEKTKCENFENGLNVELRARTRINRYTNYNDLVDAAFLAESIEQDLQQERKRRRTDFQDRQFQRGGGSSQLGSGQSGGRGHQGSWQDRSTQRGGGSWQQGSRFGGGRRDHSFSGGRQTQSVPGSRYNQSQGSQGLARQSWSSTARTPANFQGFRIPQCGTCGRFHRGDCRFETRTCYQCGEPGHVRWDCPQLKSGPGQGQAHVNPQAYGGSGGRQTQPQTGVGSGSGQGAGARGR